MPPSSLYKVKGESITILALYPISGDSHLSVGDAVLSSVFEPMTQAEKQSLSSSLMVSNCEGEGEGEEGGRERVHKDGEVCGVSVLLLLTPVLISTENQLGM